MTITLESPLRLRKRLRATFSPNTMKEQLDKLKRWAYTDLLELEYLPGSDRTIPLNLVRFYQVVSPWCEMGAELYKLDRKLARIDYGQYLKARQALVALAAQDERDIYGVNRTHSGEPPPQPRKSSSVTVAVFLPRRLTTGRESGVITPLSPLSSGDLIHPPSWASLMHRHQTSWPMGSINGPRFCRISSTPDNTLTSPSLDNVGVFSFDK